MKRRIEVKVINRYGEVKRVYVYNARKDAEQAAARLKKNCFDDVTITVTDATNYKKEG